MLIDVGGKQYKVWVSSIKAGVQCIGIRDGIVELSVHHQVPKHELLTYLQANHVRLQKEARHMDAINGMWIEIQMFGHTYMVKEDPKVQKPFMKGAAISTSVLPKTPKQIEQLKASILQDQITLMVGLWEDRLEFMLEKVAVKTLHANSYSISKNRRQISYTKTLSDVSPEMLEYIVATSIFDYLRLDAAQKSLLYGRHVKDWKHLDRIYRFERFGCR